MSCKEKNPVIGIIMGSESPTCPPRWSSCMKATRRASAYPMRCRWQVPTASRPKCMDGRARPHSERGIRVIIAAAGKAAHPGGVVAAYTPNPVITVPMQNASDLGGLDSLLSMVEMPSGVPVACVAINGAKNAAILAVQIMGTGRDGARQKIIDFKKSMAEA